MICSVLKLLDLFYFFSSPLCFGISQGDHFLVHFFELHLFAISAFLLEMLLFLFPEPLVYTGTGGVDLNPALSDTVTALPGCLEGSDLPICGQI